MRRSRHFVAHELLENYADLRPQAFQIVFAEGCAIEKNLSFGGVVQSREQLDDGGLSLAVLTDDGNPLRRPKFETHVLQHLARTARVLKRDILEFEALADFLRHLRRIRDRRNSWLYREEFEQVGHK